MLSQVGISGYWLSVGEGGPSCKVSHRDNGCGFVAHLPTTYTRIR